MNAYNDDMVEEYDILEDMSEWLSDTEEDNRRIIMEMLEDIDLEDL